MHIEFTARNVSYNEAVDGEIVQVSFEEDGDDDPIEPSKYYFHISVNYEFPPILPSLEWFDGSKCDGGGNIIKYKLNRNSLQLWLDNGMSFDMHFEIKEVMLNDINEFITNVLA
jgi:hypothetical protein